MKNAFRRTINVLNIGWINEFVHSYELYIISELNFQNMYKMHSAFGNPNHQLKKKGVLGEGNVRDSYFICCVPRNLWGVATFNMKYSYRQLNGKTSS